MARGRLIVGLVLALALVLGTGCRQADPDFLDMIDGRGGALWIGNAVCYGPHRDGQRPGGPSPSADQIREDLRLMSPHWRLLRVYGADEVSETILRVIRQDGLEMKVMLGVWIAPPDEKAEEANARQVANAVRLAAEYPDIVVAVSVGNETQVEWSAHRCDQASLLRWVRTVKHGVKQPVTVADDFNFWNKEVSGGVADQLDFLTVHAHPLWNGQQLDEALPWLQARLNEVRARHPGRRLVLGETGWATGVHTEGEQARLIKGVAGEAEQAEFYRAVRAWADSTRTVTFFFEAFDENWKGGPHPAEVEKHWGVFAADRSEKAALIQEAAR